MTLVDDFGRYDGRAALLHGECFSLRNDVKPQRTAALLRELQDRGLIKLYKVEDKEYLQVLRWKEHPRAVRSLYPELLDNPRESAADRSASRESATSLVPRSSSSPSSSGKMNFPNGLTDSEWLSRLAQDKTYEGIDVIQEHGKMVNWCKTNQKTPTRKRFVNWLNRAERPMRVVAKEKRKEALW